MAEDYEKGDDVRGLPLFERALLAQLHALTTYVAALRNELAAIRQLLEDDTKKR